MREKPNRVRARPVEWDEHGQLAVAISTQKSAVFVGQDQLRELADLLHDVADLVEETKEVHPAIKY